MGAPLEPQQPDPRRIRELFARALSLEGAGRSAFLADACRGDDALRREVDELLRAAEQAQGGRGGPGAPEPPQTQSLHSRPSVEGLAGKSIGHFQIEKQIGRGGMGVVYRAVDTRLGRTVALKFLYASAAGSATAHERFMREARAAAALDHPSIGSILEIGDWEGQPYIVMGHYEGVTLAERIRRGPMPVAEVEATLSQIAAGLEAAHAAGVVHRDLKPSNVILTHSGQAKILDFGLAKLVSLEERTSQKLSSDGVVLGTLAYMSPEQARGDEVDHRTDLWAAGVIAYEMLTGISPFQNESTAATLARIMTTEPRPVSEIRRDVPPKLANLTARLLCKDRNGRPAHALAIVDALAELPVTMRSPVRAAGGAGRRRRALGVVALIAIAATGAAFLWKRSPSARVQTPSAEPPLSIAVADVVNETGSPELDGLSGLLTTALEQSHKLSVLTRSRMVAQLGSVGRAPDSRIDEGLGLEICKSTHTGALVVATVRRFDEMYSVDIKVVAPDRHDYLFTAKEEGNGKASIPAQIDRLSEKTRTALRERKSEVEGSQASVASVTTQNLEAYQHYFLGQQHDDALRTGEAIAEYEKAVALDPDFAVAWYRLAGAKESEVPTSGRKAMARAMELLDHAPEKERLLIRALDAEFRGDVAEERALLEEAYRRYPQEKAVLTGLAGIAPDDETSVMWLKRALDVDPNNEGFMYTIIHNCTRSHRYEEALEMARIRFARKPSGDAQELLANALFFVGRCDEALAEARKVKPRFGEDHGIPSLMRASCGDVAGARDELVDLIAAEPERRSLHFALGHVSMLLGQTHRAGVEYETAGQIAERTDDNMQVATARLWAALAAQMGGASPADIEILLRRVSDVRGGQSWWYYYYLFHAYLLAGRLDDAERVPTGGDVPEERARMLVDAERLRIRGSLADAVAAYETAATKLPYWERPFARARQASCLLDLGRASEARTAVTEVEKDLALDDLPYVTLRPIAYYLEGRVEEAEGHDAAAIERYDKLLDLWKDADICAPELDDARVRAAELRSKLRS